jgi:hypothetical protein
LTPLLLLAIVVLVNVELAGCAGYGVVIDVDAAAVDEDATFDAAFYADDGGGCAGQRFVAAPALTLIAREPLPLTGLELPRVGAKLVIVEARRGDLVVGRGCRDIEPLDGVVRVEVTIAPTHRLVDASAESLVVGDATVLDDDFGKPSIFTDHVSAVVDNVADGSPVAGAAVRARLFAADGALVVDEVVVADEGGRAFFAPRAAPAGPVRATLTVENPATDGDTTSPGFAVPRFELIPTNANALRPFVVDGVPLFAGVSTRLAPRLQRFEGRRGKTIASATRSMILVGLATADTGNDVFVIVADGTLAFIDTAASTVEPIDPVEPVEPVEPGPVIDVSAAARYFSASSCATPFGLPGVIGDGTTQFLVDIDDVTGAAVAAPLDIAVNGAVVGSFCVLGDGGTRHRVVVFGGERPGVVDLGDGLTSAGDFSTLPIVAGLENTIALTARDDGLLLSSEADAGEVLVRLRRLSAGAFVDAGAPPARLPSPPTFLAAGNFFGASGSNQGGGGANDLFAVLSLGTAVRPDLAALYGVGNTSEGGIAGGIAVPACAPAAACSDALAVDIDGDGVLEVLTSLEDVAVIVHFR